MSAEEEVPMEVTEPSTSSRPAPAAAVVGNDLEWQFKFQQRTQKPEERLPEYAGTLRALADKAYPKWPAEQLNELDRKGSINSWYSFLYRSTKTNA